MAVHCKPRQGIDMKSNLIWTYAFFLVTSTLIAYLAWKKQTETMRLAPVEGFTPDQRFFIGFAQWACENNRDENSRLLAATNPHSPGLARINGIVTNMPDFATAFSCKAGQPMVKANVCKVW